jgi:hypothetical protein
MDAFLCPIPQTKSWQDTMVTYYIFDAEGNAQKVEYADPVGKIFMTEWGSYTPVRCITTPDIPDEQPPDEPYWRFGKGWIYITDSQDEGC